MANTDNGSGTVRLAELGRGEKAVLEQIDLPDALAERLMVMGFVPGAELRPAGSAPGGDPRVYQVDGAEVALRRDTAEHLLLRPAATNGHG